MCNDVVEVLPLLRCFHFFYAQQKETAYMSTVGVKINPILESKNAKTINIRDSLVVTHPTTSLTAHWLSTAERTGSPVFNVLWSIAKVG
jgi:hypothetical protein